MSDVVTHTEGNKGLRKQALSKKHYMVVSSKKLFHNFKLDFFNSRK